VGGKKAQAKDSFNLSSLAPVVTFRQWMVSLFFCLRPSPSLVRSEVPHSVSAVHKRGQNEDAMILVIMGVIDLKMALHDSARVAGSLYVDLFLPRPP
jgi:hypothetical protein